MAGLTGDRGGSRLPKGGALISLKEATPQGGFSWPLWSPPHPQVAFGSVPTSVGSHVFLFLLLGWWETSKKLLGLYVRGGRALHSLLRGRHGLLPAFLGFITRFSPRSILSGCDAGPGRRWGRQAASCIQESY